MRVRTIEIRDRGTFIPALAIKLQARTYRERLLLSRAGYGDGYYVILMRLDGGDNLGAQSDPYEWNPQTRTMHYAHLWLTQNIDKVFHEDGDPLLVDVQFILGETDQPKESEL